MRAQQILNQDRSDGPRFYFTYFGSELPVPCLGDILKIVTITDDIYYVLNTTVGIGSNTSLWEYNGYILRCPLEAPHGTTDFTRKNFVLTSKKIHIDPRDLNLLRSIELTGF